MEKVSDDGGDGGGNETRKPEKGIVFNEDVGKQFK